MYERIPALETLFDEYQLTSKDRAYIVRDLLRLKKKDLVTYSHSIRTTFLAMEIAKYLGLNPRALLFAGPRHDVGKLEVPDKILKKKGIFNDADRAVMSQHPTDTAIHVSQTNPYSALIGVNHHRHAVKPYPKSIPKIEALQNLSHEAKISAHKESKLLAIADWFDAAVYRRNSKFIGKEVTLDVIRREMIKEMPKLKGTIDKLFEGGFFKTEMLLPLKRNKYVFPKRFAREKAIQSRVFKQKPSPRRRH
ncbi:MAG: HD domain-containing protein [archaeon]|jgi:hypothetical protein